MNEIVRGILRVRSKRDRLPFPPLFIAKPAALRYFVKSGISVVGKHAAKVSSFGSGTKFGNLAISTQFAQNVKFLNYLYLTLAGILKGTLESCELWWK